MVVPLNFKKYVCDLVNARFIKEFKKIKAVYFIEIGTRIALVTDGKVYFLFFKEHRWELINLYRWHPIDSGVDNIRVIHHLENIEILKDCDTKEIAEFIKTNIRPIGTESWWISKPIRIKL